MRNWTLFQNFEIEYHKTKGKRSQIFCDNIFTFDIETTSAFNLGGKWTNFDRSKKDYSDVEKIGFMYIWQFGVDEVVYYGRSWSEFKSFLKKITEINPEAKKVIWVHNLSFEFQFLLNVFEDTEINVFARKARHPMRVEIPEYNVEFRCSYIVTNMSLEKTANAFDLPVKKLTGGLDYGKIRNSQTVLSVEEMEYCKRDCEAVYYLIKKLCGVYGYPHKIPMTQTGQVRQEVRGLYAKDNSHIKKIHKMQPLTVQEFNIIYKAFSGGYTHANAVRSGRLYKNVESYDISSSYPTVMIAEKYPLSRFYKIKDVSVFDKEKYAFLFHVKLFNLNCNHDNTYLSKSKCLNCYKALEDNGRIVSADSVELIVTDVDMEIIEKNYTYTREDVNTYVAVKGYLDKKFISFILELFRRKTEYKGVAGQEDNYMRSKQFINALYGMCVTNVIKDEVIFNREWILNPMTIDEMTDKLESNARSYKTFLSFAWGVWVTAYARRNLWSAIFNMDDDVLYADTDSVKIVNADKHKKFFERYNAEIFNKLAAACEYHNIPKTSLEPMDKKGNKQRLGEFQYEGKYGTFKTLGAKKYAYTDEKGKLHITISGVKKSAADHITMDDFREGFIFGYDISGRSIISYDSNQNTAKVTDYQGNVETVNQKYGINVMPTTYEIGISDLYAAYLEKLARDNVHKSEILEGMQI